MAGVIVVAAAGTARTRTQSVLFTALVVIRACTVPATSRTLRETRHDATLEAGARARAEIDLAGTVQRSAIMVRLGTKGA